MLKLLTCIPWSHPNRLLVLFFQLWPGPVCLSQFHGFCPVCLLLPEVRASTRRHVRHGVQSISGDTWEGGDVILPRPGRGPGVGPHQGGEDHPQEHQEVSWLRSWTIHGDSLRGSLQEYSVPSVVFWSLCKLKSLLCNLKQTLNCGNIWYQIKN